MVLCAKDISGNAGSPCQRGFRPATAPTLPSFRPSPSHTPRARRRALKPTVMNPSSLAPLATASPSPAQTDAGAENNAKPAPQTNPPSHRLREPVPAVPPAPAPGPGSRALSGSPRGPLEIMDAAAPHQDEHPTQTSPAAPAPAPTTASISATSSAPPIEQEVKGKEKAETSAPDPAATDAPPAPSPSPSPAPPGPKTPAAARPPSLPPPSPPPAHSPAQEPVARGAAWPSHWESWSDEVRTKWERGSVPHTKAADPPPFCRHSSGA